MLEKISAALVCKRLRFNEPEYWAAVKLREDVLRKPLGLFFQAEDFAFEKDHIHFGVFDRQELIGAFQNPPRSRGKN